MERLKQIRENKGILQKDVAAYLGIGRTTYVKYETGASEPSIEMILKMADFFSVTTDYLLGYDSLGVRENREQITSSDEIELIKIYRSMNGKGKAWLMENARIYGDNPQFIKPSQTNAAI